MSQDPKNARATPHEEARPLRPNELTDEQRTAGAKATELLEAMARFSELKSSPGKFGEKHAYFPVLDAERQSRVILLDGERGSGKSALLLTLLHLYQQALVEQWDADAPMKGWEDKGWVLPEKRSIVPVGLIDLEPLHLSLRLLVV